MGRDVRTVRRIISAFQPYRGRVAVVLVSIVLTSVLGLVTALLVKAIFDEAIGRRDLGRLLLYTAAMFLVPVASNLIGMGQSVLNTGIAQNVIRDFRNRLFSHMQRMSLRFYTETRAGEIQSRLMNDVEGVQGVITNTAATAVSNLATVVSAGIAMVCISPILTLLSFVLLPVFLFITYRVGKIRRAMNEERQRTLADLSVLIQETLSVSGALLVKTFGRQEKAGERFARENEKLVELELRQQVVGRWGFLGFGTVFSLIPALVYLIAGWQMIRGTSLFGTTMTAGTLVAFTALQGRFFAPAGQLLGLQSDIQAALALFDRIFEYLDLPVDIADAPEAIRLKPAEVRGEVVFDHVSFAYRGAAPALRDVSFAIRPGQMVALVGPSGAGKTTIAYLLPRLYDADRGAVTIDGHDVRRIALSCLSEWVGVVTQEPYLLHATIRENLLYGRPGATEGEMIAAARDAAIHDRIMESDQGYDTVVGERGYRLSGGEKQRLAIARTMLKAPRILILDEATSALDVHSERLVQQALDKLMRGRTTLVIAHRLSTVVAADLILVVNKGEIAERGAHDELLARRGLYSRLYQEQFVGTPRPA